MKSFSSPSSLLARLKLVRYYTVGSLTIFITKNILESMYLRCGKLSFSNKITYSVQRHLQKRCCDIQEIDVGQWLFASFIFIVFNCVSIDFAIDVINRTNTWYRALLYCTTCYLSRTNHQSLTPN